MKKWVPDRAHRAQLLHLSTGTHISAVLYTQASTIRPLHSLLVEFPDNLCAAWQRLLGHANAKWGLEIPERQADWGTAVDANTVHLHRALRVAMIDLVDRSGEPIPAVDYVKPTVITMWNKLKFLIDGTTRQLKNIQVKDESLGAQMYLFNRLLKLIFLNCHLLLGMLSVYPEMERSEFKTLHQYRTTLHSRQGPVQDFMGDMGKSFAAQQEKVNEPILVDDAVPTAPTFSNQHKRLSHFSTPTGIAQRDERGAPHRKLYFENNTWCSLCDESFLTDLKRGYQHAGHQSHYACLECGEVKLCKQSRHNIDTIVEAGFRMRGDGQTSNQENDMEADDDEASEDVKVRMVSCGSSGIELIISRLSMSIW
jgi:hypothetical protein